MRKGQSMTPESRAKISAAHRGRPKSAEHREKIRAANIGRKVSVETRARISASKKGRGHPQRQETRAKIGAGNLIHGHSIRREGRESATYRTWMDMWKRCTNPKCASWQYYGGRGIAICWQWREFAAFLDDMGERPAGKTLDRIDVNGNYEPGNCRWATAREQRLNQRPRVRPLTPLTL